eukprot:2818941-Rhodomonas_salina.1
MAVPVPSWHLVPVGLVAKIMKKGSDLTPQEFLVSLATCLYARDQNPRLIWGLVLTGVVQQARVVS